MPRHAEPTLRAPSTRCIAAAVAVVFGASSAAAQTLPAVVIGAPASLTGSFASNGVPMAQAMRMFAAQVNAAGGVRMGAAGFAPLELRIINDNSTEAGVRAAATSLVLGGAHVLVGPHALLTAAALRALYAPAMPNITVVSPTASEWTLLWWAQAGL